MEPLRTFPGDIRELLAEAAIAQHADSIDIWTFSLSGVESNAAHSIQLLSRDECEQAYAFATRGLEASFIVTKALTRLVLARYTGERPEAIRFAYAPHGKPSVSGNPTLHFNTSACSTMFVLAVTRSGALGIDVERLRPFPDAASIAQHFFCREEAEYIEQYPEHERSAAFLQLWTCKEAVLKATGEGLTRELRSFRVSFDGDLRCSTPSVFDADAPARRWMLKTFGLGSDHVAAIAFVGQPRRLRFIDAAPRR